MTAKAAALHEQGVDIVTLSQGEPDFDTPEAVKKSRRCCSIEGRMCNTPVAGVKPLREVIREKLARDTASTMT